MNKQELVRNEMVKAMKEKDKSKKETLSLLLAALKNAEIDKMGILFRNKCYMLYFEIAIIPYIVYMWRNDYGITDCGKYR